MITTRRCRWRPHICRDSQRLCASAVKAVMALGILLACCRWACALDPSLDISQYAHTAWKIRDSFIKRPLTSIAQTPDGYLWLGTQFGLLRFDGIRAIPWEPPTGEQLPSEWIWSLLVARDGTLWIGTRKGLASWKDGKLMQYPELAGQPIPSLVEDREGTVWASWQSISAGSLCAIRSGKIQCYGEDGNFGNQAYPLYQDNEGNLWVGAKNGLWHWRPGAPKLYPAPWPNGLTEVDNRSLLMATGVGLKQLVDGKVEAYLIPGGGQHPRLSTLLRDRNGGLWIGTVDHGLLHVHQGRTDTFAQSDGLSGNFVIRLFEDREGNVWVTTPDGLDRFRDSPVHTISVKQGLSTAPVWPVLAAEDGSVWLGTPDGLNRWTNGQITIYRKQSGLPGNNITSIFQEDRGRIWISTDRGVAYLDRGRFTTISGLPGAGYYSIAGDSEGNLWSAAQNDGLSHLVGTKVVERIPWAKLGRKDWATFSISDPVQGGLWLGFLGGGLTYFKDGRVRASYGVANGLGEGHVGGLDFDQDGTLWAATQGGLSRVKNGHVATLSSKNGLPCDTVHWSMEDNEHSVWLDMACGLVRVARPELDAWVTDSSRKIQLTVFDSSDGVTTAALDSTVAKTADGKLWFADWEGVSVVDPCNLHLNKFPPPVHIEQITADRKTYWRNWSGDASSLRPKLPPLVRDLEIDYTALSMVVPEKNRFRVKLEGWDSDWKDAGNERRAFYGNLPPRNYRFRVIACNNSGVWNEAGDTLDFSIAPAYYQTLWFHLACVAAFLGLLWTLYQYRLHQVAQEFNRSLEARVEERTRIARELHDTLLQSLHGLMFRFQAARNMLPARPDEAMQALDGALTRADQALAESQDAIRDLRSQPVVQGDLAYLLTAAGQELAGSQGGNGDSPNFSVTVEGERQTVSPILQDEVYRIAREVLRNAFRHARARQIEAEIRYDDRLLRLRIRDDGKGIDPEVLKKGGRDGHWGLAGIRERAERIGARVDFWSEAGAGTEVQLTVPASVAYANNLARRRSWFSGWRK